MSASGEAGRALGKRLLSHELGDSIDPNDVAIAGGAVCHKMFLEIGQFIGIGGFQVLLTRALDEAKREFPFLESVRVGEPGGGWLTGLSGSVGQRSAAEVSNGVAALMTGFFDLLSSFIGHDIVMRMVHRSWPDVLGRHIPGDERNSDG